MLVLDLLLLLLAQAFEVVRDVAVSLERRFSCLEIFIHEFGVVTSFNLLAVHLQLPGFLSFLAVLLLQSHLLVIVAHGFLHLSPL